MNEDIKKIVELEIDLDNLELEEMGVEVVSFVEQPAIEVDFMAFAAEKFVEPKGGESEDDFISRCMPIVTGEGYDNDQALAICYSYYEGSFDGLEDACWPGYEAIGMKPGKGGRMVPNCVPIENSADTSALNPYVDQLGDDLKKKNTFNDEYTEEQKIILEWAKEHGEQITEDYTAIDPNEEFSSVTDIAKAIQGLDILGKLGVRKDEPAEIKYKYTGPSAERGFCKALMSLNKLYSFADMRSLRRSLGTINPGMGRGGRNSYDVFKYKGGVNCRHYWSKVALFKPEGSRRVLMIDQGPAEGDAGKTNNEDYTGGASGSVRNNASLRFSFNVMDDEKRIVAGPLMVPNKFIIRRDENGDPYYVFFSKDTIKRIQERFNKQQRQNHTDVDHDGNILDNNILLEQWIIESRVHDKSRYYGYDTLPTGTWFGVYKVNDDQVWNRIKNGELRGFSIAGDFINKAKPVENSDEGLLSKIANILNSIEG
jgi:hypothetical protein